MKSFYKNITTEVFFLTLVYCCTANSITAEEKIKTGKDRFEKKSLVGKQADGSYIVPTSQMIDPAGTTITFPGRPMDIALNPVEIILAVKNIYNIVFFDVTSQSIKQTLNLLREEILLHVSAGVIMGKRFGQQIREVICDLQNCNRMECLHGVMKF